MILSVNSSRLLEFEIVVHNRCELPWGETRCWHPWGETRCWHPWSQTHCWHPWGKTRCWHPWGETCCWHPWGETRCWHPWGETRCWHPWGETRCRHSCDETCCWHPCDETCCWHFWLGVRNSFYYDIQLCCVYWWFVCADKCGTTIKQRLVTFTLCKTVYWSYTTCETQPHIAGMLPSSVDYVFHTRAM